MTRPSATASSGASAGAEATWLAMILPMRSSMVDDAVGVDFGARGRRRSLSQQARDVVGIAFADRHGAGGRGRARRIAKDREPPEERVGMEVLERAEISSAPAAPAIDAGSASTGDSALIAASMPSPPWGTARSCASPAARARPRRRATRAPRSRRARAVAACHRPALRRPSSPRFPSCSSKSMSAPYRV